MPRHTATDTTIGQRIQTLRQARGWSIRLAADRAGLSPSTWSRIERGLMGADNRFVVSDIAAALECSVTDLTGQPGMPSDRTTAEAQAGVEAIRAALVETDLDEDPVCTPRPIQELAQESELVADLRRRCDYAGVGQRLPRLLRELHAAARGPDRREALRLLVTANAVAAGTVRYVASPVESWVAAERCWQAARELGDPVLMGVAEFERAHAATGCGSYRRGLTVATRAVDALEPHAHAPGGSEALGMLHLTVAFASLGVKEPGAVPDRLAEAERLAARTGDSRTMMFGPTNVAFWRVSMEVDAGDPGRAVAIARDVNPAAVDSPSRQVAFYTDTARALARTKQDVAALRMLLTAEKVSPSRVRSAPLPRETARVLLERSNRATGRVELAGLCERMGLAF